MDSGQLAVTPARADPMFEHIYRAAEGVEWDREGRRFLAPSDYILSGGVPHSPLQDVRRLARAFASEMGMRPRGGPETIWVGMPEDAMTDVVAFILSL